MKRIFVIGNGPSAYSDAAREMRFGMFDRQNDRVCRTNYFYLPDGDPFGYYVTDWFICEDIHDVRIVRAAERFIRGSGYDHDPMFWYRWRVWFPGLDMAKIDRFSKNDLAGFDVRVQRFANLPAGCRWDRDLRPERPLMGSFAIAVAVGMQPDELVLAGHDLFSHPAKMSHGGMSYETRGEKWQQSFSEQYRKNLHFNHSIDGDLKYIEAALDAFEGHATIVGNVLAKYLRSRYKGRGWNWLAG